MNEDKIFDLVTKIKKENVEAIALLGSYARGEAQKYSDSSQSITRIIIK